MRDERFYINRWEGRTRLGRVVLHRGVVEARGSRIAFRNLSIFLSCDLKWLQNWCRSCAVSFGYLSIWNWIYTFIRRRVHCKQNNYVHVEFLLIVLYAILPRDIHMKRRLALFNERFRVPRCTLHPLFPCANPHISNNILNLHRELVYV